MFGDRIEEYEILEHLGKGGFAHVYRARCRISGAFVAIKMIDKGLMASAGMIGRVRQEVTIHSRLKHPAILELYTFFEDIHYVYLVLELAHNGELAKHFKLGTRGLSERAAADIFQQVVSGVVYLHTHNIIHRDLSLNNLLLTKDLNVKIADFGLATQLNGPDEKHVTMCGTPNYISPEVASRDQHGLPTDVWGLGCMLYTLLVGSPPFHTQHVKTTLNRVINADYKIPIELSHQAHDLLQRLLCKDPTKRITLKCIMEHPFLNNSAMPILKQDMSRDSGFLTTVHSTQHSSKSRTSDYKNSLSPANCLSSNSNDNNCSPRVQGYNLFQNVLDNAKKNQATAFPMENSEGKFNLIKQINNKQSSLHSLGKQDSCSNQQSICDNLNSVDIRLQRFGSACRLDDDNNKENLSKPGNVNSNTIGVPPLCAERLPNITHRTRNAILKIDSNGVTVEFIRKKNRDREEKVTEVCNISKDGMKVVLFAGDVYSNCNQKNIDPTPDEIFSYHNLPQKHWKKYLYASKFVDLVKAKTPKITIYSPLAKCQLMENGTDIEMFFYNGEKVTYTTADGLKVIDCNLRTHLNARKVQELKYLVDHFEDCSNRMQRVQAALTSIPDECFPLIIGKRPALQQPEVVMSPSNHAVSYNTPLLNLGSFRTTASTQARSDYTH